MRCSDGNSTLYSSFPSTLRSVTVSARVLADARSVPKNCRPSLGGRFCFIPGGMPMNFSSGPKVRSSSAGPNVPACAGPATNSQNGWNSVNAARAGIVVVRGAVVHVAGHEDDVADSPIAHELRSRLAISSSRPSGGPSSPLATASKSGPSTTVSPSGRSLAMIFHVAVDVRSRRFSQATCVATQNRRFVGQDGLAIRGVRARGSCACRTRRSRPAVRTANAR